ncbi:MAG: sensor histidine kinase N-terminal domain-containing protein [Betaproteobacteria bacterium]|nr:sensor histidine kinase N-terminal domain-containing protein [Betaproteobacteria bacterium]
MSVPPEAPPGIKPQDDILSLRHHLVNWLFTPLYLLLLFSTMTGYIAAVNLSNRPYDLVLTERARLLSNHFQAGDLDLAQLARSLPEGEGAFLYALYDQEGRVVIANAQLPRPRPGDLTGPPLRLRNTQFEDRKIRLLTLRFNAARAGVQREYVIQAGEPTEDRQSLGRSILGNIVIPQVIFIVIAGFAVWIGIKRGFQPLERLRRQVAERPRNDLRPLDEGMAPAEVRPFIREINALLERIGAMLESQRRFVADAAHQLRTPFAGLKAQAELARREEHAPPGIRESLDRICQGAQRCSRLVNQLLTLARNEPEAAGSRLPEPLDLHRLAQSAAMDWAPEAVQKGIDLALEAPEMQLPVRGEEGPLRDLIDNLLDNAIRYTPAGGHVTVRLGYDDSAWLMVEDDGAGIPAELREKVFERFWRVPGSNQPGTGLGLAIVAEVAARHGARIRLETGAGGHGAAFTVRFPHHGVMREEG